MNQREMVLPEWHQLSLTERIEIVPGNDVATSTEKRRPNQPMR